MYLCIGGIWQLVEAVSLKHVNRLAFLKETMRLQWGRNWIYTYVIFVYCLDESKLQKHNDTIQTKWIKLRCVLRPPFRNVRATQMNTRETHFTLVTPSPLAQTNAISTERDFPTSEFLLCLATYNAFSVRFEHSTNFNILFPTLQCVGYSVVQLVESLRY